LKYENLSVSLARVWGVSGLARLTAATVLSHTGVALDFVLLARPVLGPTLVLVDAERMAELHKQYMAEPDPTDVLTFDMRDAGDAPLEGDLILCRDVARAQAEQRGHSARQELLLYAVHGLLHMLGHDDHESEAWAAMHQRENELLTAVGEGAIYGVVEK